MKRSLFFLVIQLLIYSSVLSAFLKDEIDLDDYVWVNTSSTFPKNGLNSKTIQGGAYYDGKFYQFHDKTGGIRIFNATTRTQIGDVKPLNCDERLHHGSAAFSNEFSYVNKEGVKVNLTLPLVYSSGHYDSQEIIDVIDIENDVLVRQYFFENRRDDVIGAWDFENKRFWIIGYEIDKTAITPYYIVEYKFKEDGTYEQVGNPVLVGMVNSTLQDCHYYDGHIYILAGWGPSHDQYVKIHDYNVETKKIEKSITSPTTNEGEGFGFVEETKSFIATTWAGKTATYWEVVKKESLWENLWNSLTDWIFG